MRVIRQCQRLIIRPGANHTGDGGEHFLAIDPPVIAGAGNNAGCHVMAVMRHIEALAAAQDLAALTFCQRDIIQIFGKLTFADNRADLRAIFQRMTNLQRLRGRHQPVDKRVMHGVMNNQA